MEMDETIRVCAVNTSDWSSVLRGFQPETIQQVLEVYDSHGQKVGTLCESTDGKSYINGQPRVAYTSLQAAAAALFKGES